MTPQQIEAAQRPGLLILDAIHDGSSSGIPYDRLLSRLTRRGCNTSQFISLVGGLERKGMIRREAQNFFVTQPGADFRCNLRAKFYKLPVLEAADKAGLLGTPGGHLYLAFMQSGFMLEEFQSLMFEMVGEGLVAHEFDCYTITEAGRQYLMRVSSRT